MIQNARAGEVVQGGSTITQQLVGSTLGPNRFDQSVEGKLQELALAIRVEQQYSKARIFELYLNQVYMGNGVYGFGTASQFYFRKPARRLTLLEGATLAGMVRAPEYYDPLDRPKKMLLRRNDVLNRMEGLGWISEARNDRLKAKPLKLPENAGQAPSPPSSVLREVPDRPDRRERAPESSTRSAAPRRRGGERSTRAASTSTRRSSRNGSSGPRRLLGSPSACPSTLRPDRPPPDVSIVTIDNRSGAVKVILSGRNYREDKLDLATTGHQPGSAFKPFVLAGAFERGIPPTQTYSSSSPWCSPLWDDEDHCVENAEGSGSRHRRPVDRHRGLDQRRVRPAHLRCRAEGRREHRRADDRDGSHGPRDSRRWHPSRPAPWPSRPIDMATGYQTIANDGRHCDPYTVQSIERDGKVLLTHERTCDPVLKAGDAHLITKMLEAVPVSGTAASAFGAWGSWPVAGKTGTAQENTNVWFGGYTKQFTTVVWVGSPGNPYSMGHVFGGTVAAPIWVAYMSRVMQGLPSLGFPEPPKPPEGPVPSVIGMTKKEAITTLSEAGFRASVEIADSLSTKGRSFSQSPGGGIRDRARHARDGPDLDGRAGAGRDATGRRACVASTAKHSLEALGLVVTTVRVEAGNPNKIGFVIAQDPRSQRLVVPG